MSIKFETPCILTMQFRLTSIQGVSRSINFETPCIRILGKHLQVYRVFINLGTPCRWIHTLYVVFFTLYARNRFYSVTNQCLQGYP